MNGNYYLTQTGEKVQQILDQVEDKTVYDVATQNSDGLMSASDKQKLDGCVALTNMEIEELLNNSGC